MSISYLGQLPKEHPLRNKPLGDIRAETHNRESCCWSKIRTQIERLTYNELGHAWVDHYEFRVRDEKALDNLTPSV